MTKPKTAPVRGECKPILPPLETIAQGIDKRRFVLLANQSQASTLAEKFGLNMHVCWVDGLVHFYAGEQRMNGQPACGAMIQFGDLI